MPTFTPSESTLAALILPLDASAVTTAVAALADRVADSSVHEQAFADAAILAQILSHRAQHEDSHYQAVTERAETVLTGFLTDLIACSNPTDVQRFKLIVDIARRHEKFLGSVLECAIETLQTYCSFLREDNTLLVSGVQSTQVSNTVAKLQPVEDPQVPATERKVLQYLCFLKVSAWARVEENVQDAATITDMLVFLLGATSEAISTSSYEALVSLTTRCKGDKAHDDDPGSILLQLSNRYDILWEKISELCANSTTVRFHHGTVGYSLWASLIYSHGPMVISVTTMKDKKYWTILQQGLAYGTSQQRKLCLYILKASLLLLEGESIDCPSMRLSPKGYQETCKQYARYSTHFETIVLARYLNQVQDCLTDLTTMVRSVDSVQPGWLVALLTSALGDGIQDSVRKIIGKWLLHVGAFSVLLEDPALAANFLQYSFLPWATLGYHFSSSIRYAVPGQAVCVHGEELQQFLRAILAADATKFYQAVIIKAILSFVISCGGQMFPFARAYVLEGLLRGIESSQYEMDEHDIHDVVKISAHTGFNEMVRDLMILQSERLVSRRTAAAQSLNITDPLLRISSSLKANASDGEESRPETRLATAVHAYLESKSSVAGCVNLIPATTANHIAQLNIWIQQSRAKCLVGSGLHTAAAYLLHGLDNLDGDNLDVETLDTVLQAVWEQYEIDDYPRSTAMIIPRIFLHPRCVAASKTDSSLLSTLNKALSDLQNTAKHRVYALWSFAASLRSIVLDIPDAALELPLKAVFVQLANDPPITKPEFELEAIIAPMLTKFVPFRTYRYYYGESEGYSLACIFDTLNKLPKSDKGMQLQRDILDDLLHDWVHQKRPVPAVSRWKTTAQLQTMLVLLEGIVPTLSAADMEEYLQSFHEVLALEQMPRFRYLLEWIIARIYVLRSEQRLELLDGITDPDITNSKNVVSLMKIATMVARLPDTKEDFAFRLMTELAVLAASPKIVIRHEAHWTIPHLWSHSETQAWRQILDNRVFARLNEHIRGTEVYKNPPAGRLIDQFDPLEDHNLTNLFQGRYLDIEPREAPKVTREDFLQVWQEDNQRSRKPESNSDSGLLPLGKPQPFRQPASVTSAESSPPDLPIGAEIPPAPQAPAPLQTKATTWKNITPTLLTTATSLETRKPRPLILVSSLIDNPYNIGGLSRISEIFGVHSMTVANTRVTASKDFTSVSVSSHLWLPIEQLKVDAIAEYLVQKKLEGWKVVGIEQTDSSKVLGKGEWRFPEKCVLVLGSERQGIPAWLLGEMDFCVEVCQVGVTRSMNVQTAAAVVLFEYARQYS